MSCIFRGVFGSSKILICVHSFILGFDPAKLEKSSYLTLAKNLFEFKKLNGLPIGIDKRISDFENPNALAYELASNRAYYHKACCNKYNQSHLKRLKTDSESSTPTLGRTLSSRRSVSAINFVDKCFFCDEKDSDEILHECQTLCLDAFVRKIALEMQNSKLISKLSESDMVATEAKYHRQCLLKLYNNYHNFDKFSLKDLKYMY